VIRRDLSPTLIREEIMKKVEMVLAYYKEADQLQRYIDAAVEHSYEI